MKELKDLSKVTQVAKNRYEAVIMASKRARILNRKRLKENEMAAAEPNPDSGMHRVAEEALNELLQGKIEVRRD
ncbi:MAG TPA: DNA-directed RNA polymerase subunit omega [candidate division Zixibacteria bacterium]|nr:DNA-directed RNA polymerase subunit omega [candidate division Zixibacteria bacterium]